jgi:dihydroxyacetone kinase-like protein
MGGDCALFLGFEQLLRTLTMQIEPALLPSFIQSINEIIEKNVDEVTALDQEIGDGDHVFNLKRGLHALTEQSAELAKLDWVAALQKIGMILMSTIGGAAGSLYGTLFVTMSKAVKEKSPLDLKTFAEAFSQGVESVKLRGRAGAGEKTMLDVLIPVAERLHSAAEAGAPRHELLDSLAQTAIQGMESTRDMVATKGRASFLGERTKGHIDAGARTAQLMICSIIEVLSKQSATPS